MTFILLVSLSGLSQTPNYDGIWKDEHFHGVMLYGMAEAEAVLKQDNSYVAFQSLIMQFKQGFQRIGTTKGRIRFESIKPLSINVGNILEAYEVNLNILDRGKATYYLVFLRDFEKANFDKILDLTQKNWEQIDFLSFTGHFGYGVTAEMFRDFLEAQEVENPHLVLHMNNCFSFDYTAAILSESQEGRSFDLIGNHLAVSNKTAGSISVQVAAGLLSGQSYEPLIRMFKKHSFGYTRVTGDKQL